MGIRFGVVERTASEWTWSWRLTVQKPKGLARVNARIRFIEFDGSISRVVRFENVCGLRLAEDRLVSVEGVQTLSVPDSQRVSAVAATVSEGTRCREGS